MATTLLQGVNKLLKRTRDIQGDAGDLTSLTDSALQTSIDRAVQVLNEILDEIYTVAEIPRPQAGGTTSIGLVTSTREYTLPTDNVQILFPLIDQTNQNYIVEYSGGYYAMLNDQPKPGDYTGLPNAAAVNPENNKLRVDRDPTANENGRNYELRYLKDTELTAATDNFPCSDAAFRAAMPAAAELWKRIRNKADMDEAIFAISIGRAARLINPVMTNFQENTYTPRRVSTSVFNVTDPFDSHTQAVR